MTRGRRSKNEGRAEKLLLVTKAELKIQGAAFYDNRRTVKSPTTSTTTTITTTTTNHITRYPTIQHKAKIHQTTTNQWDCLPKKRRKENRWW
jgi:hypothetical protein